MRAFGDVPDSAARGGAQLLAELREELEHPAEEAIDQWVTEQQRSLAMRGRELQLHQAEVLKVSTPNAGSVLALKQIVEGVRYAPIVPTYQPALLCTFPSIFQLLPRARHARVVRVE